VNIAPWLIIPESHNPLGIPGEPEVLLCPEPYGPDELHIQSTESPV